MPTTAKLIRVDALRPAEALIAAAADQLIDGKVGILPTRCLYGLGTNALNPTAIERIFSIKQRALQKPLPILIARVEQLELLATDISPLAHGLMQRFWPGKVTFLLKARPGLPPGLVGPENKVGIRLAAHPVAAALAARAGVPLTGTSANISNQPGCYRIDQMDETVTAAVDLIIDAGPLMGGIGSSIVDATLPTPRMLRCGAVSEEKFKKAVAELQ